MKVNFIAGLVLTVIVFITFAGLVIGWSGIWMFNRLLNFPCILTVVIFPLLFLLVLYGWKEYVASFSVIFKNEIAKNNLLKADKFFNNYGKTIFSMALFSFIITVSSMIMALEYQEYIGIMVIFSLTSFFYAVVISIVIVIPYRIIINRKIMEMES